MSPHSDLLAVIGVAPTAPWQALGGLGRPGHSKFGPKPLIVKGFRAEGTVFLSARASAAQQSICLERR